MTMNFNELPEFKRDFKRLHKKYKSLPDDLQTFCDTVSVTPIVKSKNFAVIHRTETIRIVKARLSCRYLKGRSLLRIVYSWNEQEQQIEFIELFFKGNKEAEDRERIRNYLKNSPN